VAIGVADEYDVSPPFGVRGIRDNQKGRKTLIHVLSITDFDGFEKRKWLTGQIWSW
jgi:hypothetical protein